MSKKAFLAQNLQQGEIYAGIVLGKNNEGDYHLFLLPAQTTPLNWDAANKWAESVGGSLPTRSEQAILYGNLKNAFEERGYWSCEQHTNDSDYAWLQYFDDGGQYSHHKSDEYRARAVRRVLIQEGK